jgi:hypothetical protein
MSVTLKHSDWPLRASIGRFKGMMRRKGAGEGKTPQDRR